MKNFFSFLIILIVCCSTTAWAQNDYEDRDENVQYVSWGVLGGPNLTGCRVYLDSTDGAPDRTRPALGFNAGAFLEYHITPQWSLQFSASGDIERVETESKGLTNHLTTYGIGISVPVCFRMPVNQGTWFCSFGPYSHFVIASGISGDGTLDNPFTRVIANDPRTGEPQFALNDFNAGITLSLGYELASQWQCQLVCNWGISDLLNVDSHDLYVKPYKLGCLVSYHFQ